MKRLARGPRSAVAWSRRPSSRLHGFRVCGNWLGFGGGFRFRLRRPLSGLLGVGGRVDPSRPRRSEEHTSELQSLMRTSYAVFCLKKKKITKIANSEHHKILHQ